MSSTDWNAYYDNPFWTSALTRRYTGSVLLGSMRRFMSLEQGISILELGGGNSCFFEYLAKNLPIKEYGIVDSNIKSVELFRKKESQKCRTEALHADVRSISFQYKADIVFSVGLIEHFNERETAQVIDSHFECVRSNGLVIISFPTPTWLYRSIRALAEKLDRWAFLDERPLEIPEVKRMVERHGQVLLSKTLWPLGLTQHLFVAKPNG